MRGLGSVPVTVRGLWVASGLLGEVVAFWLCRGPAAFGGRASVLELSPREVATLCDPMLLAALGCVEPIKAGLEFVALLSL
jgi:hypothetical protein